MWVRIKRYFGRRLATYLSQERDINSSIALCSPELLTNTLRRGDVLLVEGHTRFSTAIQYLTHSNWSHAALCIKNPAECEAGGPCLIEADILDGVREIDLSLYTTVATRICRPIGLSDTEIDKVIATAQSQLGNQYDTQKISDLVRYLVPRPPVLMRWRRRMIALGSGDPTRAICSTLVAAAFKAVRYPILPLINARDESRYRAQYVEWQQIRRKALYTPRDFDLSPYFEVVKPNINNANNLHLPTL